MKVCSRPRLPPPSKSGLPCLSCPPTQLWQYIHTEVTLQFQHLLRLRRPSAGLRPCIGYRGLHGTLAARTMSPTCPGDSSGICGRLYSLSLSRPFPGEPSCSSLSEWDWCVLARRWDVDSCTLGSLAGQSGLAGAVNFAGIWCQLLMCIERSTAILASSLQLLALVKCVTSTRGYSL